MHFPPVLQFQTLKITHRWKERPMFEFLEKTLLTAVGAFSLSQKKGEELIQEIRQRFDVTEEEGKRLLERLQSAARENQKKLEELAQQEIKKSLDKLGLVTEEEFDKLRVKVQQLESQLLELGK
jgi:polyhydroxyalkanoate synthesis regulator phasin